MHIMIKIKAFLFTILILSFCSCDSSLDFSLENAGENKDELEKVLEHFENDPNPLKYEAAKFLIENMPFHQTTTGETAEKYAEAYVSMAQEAKEFRDSIIKAKSKTNGAESFKNVSDLKSIDAEFLIRSINEACDVWSKVNWNKEYDKSLFFNYVLPYRLFKEPKSYWRESIKRDFPYLNKPIVYSVKGMQIPAFSAMVKNCKIVDSPSSLKGQAVQITKPQSAVSFNINSPLSVKKLIRFRYNTLAKDAKATIELNGKKVGILNLEPTNSIYSFRNTRFGMVLSLHKGENILTIKYSNKPFELDYIELAAYEPYYDDKSEDYSSNYCQIQNVGTGSFVSLDTLKKTMEKPVCLHRYSAKDYSLNLRLDYMGYPCWRIMPMESSNMCIEDRWVSLDTLNAIGKYQWMSSNLGNNHQKWVIIPVGNGMCKIMNKFSGLFWESGIDKQTGKEIIVQNVYSGKPTQKWKITKKEENPYAQSLYKIGSVISYGLRVTDVMNQFEYIANRGPVDPSLENLCKYRTGKCQDEASFTVSLSRYLGIPTAIDFTPHWGNRPNSHTWSVLVLPNGKSVTFYMDRAPGDTAQYTNNYVKPKIFRYRFELNRDIISDLSGETEVPGLFKLPTFTDVTDEYGETTDVKREIPKKYRDHDIAYICVNEKEEWIPVHYGKIHFGRVTFTSMGRNILYTVGFWKNGKIQPVGNPFILQNDGTIKEIVANRTKKQTMVLKRKYPFFGKYDQFNNRMGYGQFQGSNKNDFSAKTTLYTHEGITEGCWYERKIKTSGQKYKYLRYIGPTNSFCNVNEIEFYNSKNQKLKGKIIGTQGTDKQTKETVFDGDVLTGFNGNSPDGHWVGLELPQASEVAKIRYMPRNDGNCVEVGDKYQLLMYVGGNWKTLAWIRARDTKLVLKNMPSGGLYILKDRTKGNEERIFTYENGKQVWW